MLKEADTGETSAVGKMETVNVLRKDENESEENAEPKIWLKWRPLLKKAM